MNKKDIMLADEEIVKINRHANTIGLARARDIATQAQLKLLAYMKKNYQLPKDTIIYPNLLIMSGQQVDDLEKLLMR